LGFSICEISFMNDSGNGRSWLEFLDISTDLASFRGTVILNNKRILILSSLPITVLLFLGQFLIQLATHDIAISKAGSVDSCFADIYPYHAEICKLR